MRDEHPISTNSSNNEYQVDAILEQLKTQSDAQSEPENTVPVAAAPAQTSSSSLVTQPPHKKIKKKSTAGKSCLTTFLWLFCILAVSVGLAVAGIFVAGDYLGIGKDFIRRQDTREVQITVAEGATIKEIAQELEDREVLISRHVFLAYLKLTGKGDNVNYGAHDFATNMGYDAILDSLAEPAKAEDVTVTIPSGKTVEEILHLLEESGICSYADLRHEVLNGTFESPLWEAIPEHDAMYYRMEGYLFPDTYQFYPNDDPHRVIQKMLDNLEEKFTPQMRADAADAGYSTHEIMTMASIVELESCGYFDQMAKVSAVFYNRLNHWEPGARLLQSDPTMYYPYGGGAYNTYKIEGIPPGPMSNVTEQAIHAAVYPDTSMKEFYFVTDKNGGFYFNQTLSAHEATIQDLKNKGIWMTTPYFE